MTPRRLPYVLAFAVGVAATGLVTYRSYLARSQVIESGVGGQLRSIAGVKASQVAAWRAERLGDLRVLATNSVLMPSVRAVLSGTASEEATAAVSAWAEAVRVNYRYGSVVFTDPAGQVRLSTGEAFGTEPYYRDLTSEVLASAPVVFRDVGRDAAVLKSHFVLGEAVRDGGAVLGAVILAVEPRAVLSSTTLQWPTATESGDVMLVRRDGAHALHLVDLRRHPGAAMTLREPLTGEATPAVAAVLGQVDFAHRVDGDGIAALSAATAVPSSPWVVVARIDEAEAYGPLRQDLRGLLAVAAVFVLTLGAGLGWLRRRQDARFYRQQYEAASERRRMQDQFDEDRRTLEDQLRQSQKLESIGRLAGGVAHDFNNLLTVINGYSDLLKSRLGGHESLRELAVQIHKAGKRAAALTEQLLAFSRKQVTQPRLLSLNALVTDAEPMLSRLVGDDIECVLEVGARPDHVLADPGQLHQVLMNLVVNARDAMPRGGRLSVETRTADVSPAEAGAAPDVPAGRYAVLTVTDTGTGMDEQTRAQIFEPFFTTKAPGQGTGLGLSTVYGIITQGGGFLRVASAVGRGTTVSVYLPSTDEPLAQEAMPAQPLSLRGSETILIAEDQHDVRTFASRSLRSYGYRVIEAVNGVQAIEASDAHDGPLDVLLTDIAMPGLNGKELADRLVARRPDLRVIYMSGYSDDVLGERGVLDAGVAYLQKPFGPDELAAKIRSTLQRVQWPRHVLVVDDEAAIRTLFQQLLTPLGCDVLLAADGREAIEILQEHQVDLVVTDLVMLEQEGLETIMAIRRLAPQMKIVAMSGAFGGAYLDVARKLGADAILTKPIDPRRLRETIDGLFA